MTLTDKILKDFNEYPFDADADFKAGLSEILGAHTQPETESDEAAVANIIGQAKAYYFSSKCGVPFSWEEYLHQTEHQSTNTKTQPTDANHVEEGAISTDLVANPSEKEMSFAQITTLIESGQTDLIPNNESIPGGVNDASPSESTASSARKPWEASD